MSNNKDFKVKNGIQPTVYYEGLGTVVSGQQGYALSEAVYDSVSFSVSSQDLTPHDVFFKPDGSKMYIVGFENQDINEYNLSTAWDISTASFSQSFSVASQESSPKSIFFKEDGLKVYLVGYTGDSVYEYNLSTAWDISTASFSQSFSVASQDTSPLGLIFKPDGSKMYIVGNVNDSVYEYNLSTAWDISTASFLQSFSVNAQDAAPYGLSFKPDGTKMYVIGAVGQDINEYSLSTAWDISTAVFSFTLSVSSQDTAPRGLFFKPDGLKMYVLGSTSRNVYQYSTALITAELDLSTGSVFDYTPTSDVQVTLSNPAASGTSSGATLLLEGAESTGVASTFSTTLYTGNGGTQTITNGIDLAGDGGLVWGKLRAGAAESHWLVDSSRGLGSNGTYLYLSSDLTSAEFNVSGRSVSSFNSNGFTLANGANSQFNSSGLNYASWTFKKQAKFFDCVTYTGDGTNGRLVSHNLGTVPGAIIIKTTSTTGSWPVYHRSLSDDNASWVQNMFLNNTGPEGGYGRFSPHASQTATHFSLYNDGNANGVEYVAYLFAHDTDASSLIKCGSYTGNGSTTGPVVNLGFEPQWVMVKSASIAADWTMYDNVRGVESGTTGSKYLHANKNDAEATRGFNFVSNGFQPRNTGTDSNSNNQTYIYMAIRAESLPTITYDPTLEWSGGTAPTAPALGETDVVTFNTRDGGSTYQGVLAIDGAK